MYTWPAGPSFYSVVAWSGDGARALLRLNGFGSAPVEQLDLATGKVTPVPLPQHADPIGYTQPDGKNLLAFVPYVANSSQIQLERFDLAGTRQAVLRVMSAGNTGVLSSADGTEYAVNTYGGIQLISNSGAAIRTLTVPGISPGAGCDPVRWWNQTTVLASCVPSTTSIPQLWTVPVDGSAPTALTPPRSQNNTADLGDLNAWQLPSGLYLQVAGACGYIFIARQAADGSITTVHIPGAPGTNSVLAVVGSRMLVQAHSACQPGESLRWFDPGSGTVQPLLTAQPGAQGVTAAIPFGKLGG
jgi:TolB protein